jgi:uncharacterized UPF0160 family protein
MKKIVTHNSNFHADDAFAVATLQIYLDKLGEKYQVVRSRDPEIIETGDYVVDVGTVYDEDTNRFDHHQESFKEKGYLDIPYSSFGLVWKHFGKEVCESKNVWDKIRKEFVTLIDANDNGIDTQLPAIKGLTPLDPETFIHTFRPAYNERTEENLYACFLQAVDFAKGFLLRKIKKEKVKEEMRDEFEQALKNRKNILKTDSISALILPKPLPWKDFIDEENDFEFVVLEREDGSWMASGVPVSKNSMKIKFVKKAWCGLKDQELSEKAGVKDLVFYHKTGFLLVAKNKEAIIEALKAM